MQYRYLRMKCVTRLSFVNFNPLARHSRTDNKTLCRLRSIIFLSIFAFENIREINEIRSVLFKDLFFLFCDKNFQDFYLDFPTGESIQNDGESNGFLFCTENLGIICLYECVTSLNSF